MALSRWDPFSEMMSLRQAMDQLLAESVVRPRAGAGLTATGAFDLDVMERDDAVVVKASLPGVKPEDVNITVQNNVLTIQGETREERETGEGRYHHRERRYGRFSRSIGLPIEVNPNACDASFEHGVLTITLAKAEAARPRRIAIRGPGLAVGEGQGAAGGQPVIEGRTVAAGTGAAGQQAEAGQTIGTTGQTVGPTEQARGASAGQTSAPDEDMSAGASSGAAEQETDTSARRTGTRRGRQSDTGRANPT